MIIYEIKANCKNEIIIAMAEVEEKPKSYTLIKRIDKEFCYCARVLKTEINEVRNGFRGIEIFAFDIDYGLELYKKSALKLIEEKTQKYNADIKQLKEITKNINILQRKEIKNA